MLTTLTIFLIISSCLNAVSVNITDENSTDIANTQTIELKRVKVKRQKESEKESAPHPTDIKISPLMTDTTDTAQYLKDADIGDAFIVQDTSKLVNPNYRVRWQLFENTVCRPLRLCDAKPIDCNTCNMGVYRHPIKFIPISKSSQ